ncbi:hypothetical protein Dip518_000356 [Parelusimicrobium proximum]|uniref:hypothetical protein n=1 Tax=Parelusimicrobium proximum TaxID=3228953 RepID=UPI003D17B3B7
MKRFLWLFIIGLFLFVLAMQRVQVKRAGAEVAVISAEVSLKESRNQYLKYQIDKATSPYVVYPYAGEHLDMHLAAPGEIITVESK